MQQTLEYLHVPHDVQLPANRQVLLARRDVPESSLEESSPDHLGSGLDLADTNEIPASPANPKPGPIVAQVVQAAQATKEPDRVTQNISSVGTDVGTGVSPPAGSPAM